ncbi:MAG: DUF4112 domain-containing protein [Longimicrobiaceae bacterium]
MAEPAPLRSDSPRLRRLRGLGRFLDSSIPVPGTNWRFGWDALFGLVPGVGDALGATLSGYLVLEALRYRVSGFTLLRMLANVGVDLLFGLVPVLGDLFDAGYKANLRNLRLLEEHLESPDATRRASRKWILAVGAAVVAALVLMLVLVVVLAELLVRALTGG